MKNYIGQNELIMFTQNMSSLLKSGLSLQDSLVVCEKINNCKNNANFCKFLKKKISEGESLSNALKSFENKISSFYISLMEIGEETGALCDIFEKLSEYLKEKKKIKDKLRQAFTYPFIVMLTAVFVISVIVIFVFPRLESIFEVFTESSEVVALKMNGIKNGITIFCVIAILIMFVSFAIFVLKRVNVKFSFYFDKMILHIPFIKKYFITSNINDFSYAMKILCLSSISFSESVKKASGVIKNRYYRSRVEKVYQKIVEGNDIASTFESEKIFPLYLTSWILIAQTTGNIEDVFIQVSDYYKNENENIMQEIIVSAEPIFILITGILIFILVGQFVLPIFSLLGTL